MAKTSIALLYTYFETGKKPTQTQFQNLIDSFWHKDASITLANINGIQDVLDTKANAADLTAHINNEESHVSPEDRNLWNSSISSQDFEAHLNDDIAHISQEDRDTWNSKAAGDHAHGDYEAQIASLDVNKADNQHIHIGELLIAPTGQVGEVNSFRFRQIDSDTILESTSNGVDWTELQRWSRE